MTLEKDDKMVQITKLNLPIKGVQNRLSLDIMHYLSFRIELKLKLIKLTLSRIINDKDFGFQRMSSMFSRAARKKKGDYGHRIKSLWSYNVLDNPKYLDAKKIKKRIVRFYKTRNMKTLKD